MDVQIICNLCQFARTHKFLIRRTKPKLLEPSFNQRMESQTNAAAPAAIRYKAKGAKPWREM